MQFYGAPENKLWFSSRVEVDALIKTLNWMEWVRPEEEQERRTFWKFFDAISRQKMVTFS